MARTAKSFSYKLTKTKTMKMAGILDCDNMTIEIDGVDKRLSTLFSEYDGLPIEFILKVKDEEDLDEPEDDEDDDE